MKRETDLVARFGGEEFCILCEETDADGAMLLAERVREELGRRVVPRPSSASSRSRARSASRRSRTTPKTTKRLFEITDKALYAAKHGGRNRVCTSKDT